MTNRPPALRASGFVIVSSFVIRASSFQYLYDSGNENALRKISRRGSAPSAMITSTTSNRNRISGSSSSRSHARPPREIRFCFSRFTASKGRPKSSRVRVFTSTNTSVSRSRQTTSISPPVRPLKLRYRILQPFFFRNRQARFSPRVPSCRCWGREVEKRLRHRFERPSMNRTRPVFMEFEKVKFGAVTFVLAEAIFRETGAEVAHNRIAGDLRDHAGGGNTETVAIAVND